jgi:hypothetical protein
MPVLNKYRISCTTENIYTYTWNDTQPTVCPNNNSHTIDSTATTIIDSVSSSGDGGGNTNSDGDLVADVGVKNMFGNLVISEKYPVFQNYFLYGVLKTQNMLSFSNSGGSYSSTDDGSGLNLTTSNSVGSYCVIRTRKCIKFRPGYANTIKFDMKFGTAVSNSLQFGGPGNSGSDLYFCYSSTSFGVRLSSGGRPEIRTLTITAREQYKNKTGTIVLDGTTYSMSLSDADGDINFTTSELSNKDFVGWNIDVIENKIIFTSRDVGSRNGTYSFNSNGTTSGSFSRTKEGSSLTTTFVSQANWNGDSSMVQNLNPLKKNVYLIEYSWFNSGNVLFKVYNPDTSKYETVHTMTFANSDTSSLSQPNMYLQQGVASLGSTSVINTSVFGGCAFHSKKPDLKFQNNSVCVFKDITKNKDSVVLLLKNRNSVNGFSNHSEIFIRDISVNTDGSKPVMLKIIKNPTTLSSYEDDDYYSCKSSGDILLYSDTLDTYTGGTVIDSYYLPKDGYLNIQLKDKIVIYQSDIVIITAQSENNVEIDLAVSLVEDL